MPDLSEYRFSESHEWVHVEGGVATVGISDHAQSELGDVIFVELPAVGAVLKAGDKFGTIESVKAVSELYAPLSGEVIEVNTVLRQKPETVNTDPHGSWMLVVRLADAGETSNLLDAAQYEALTK